MSATIQPSVVLGLRTLKNTEVELQHTIAEAATGKAVATVADDPPAFVIANSLTSESSAWMTVGIQLGAADVPTRVANAAVNNTTSALMKLTQNVIEMQAGGEQASQMRTQMQAYLFQIANNEQDAMVNGVNLLAGAVGGGVTRTQISVPANPEGGYITLGGKSLTWMNASVAGLGLATLNGTTDGVCLNFSSLSPENIGTAAPTPTQVVVQTANYGDAAQQTGQYAGQIWTFEFTDAASPASGSTTILAHDGLGNVIQASHVVPVPLQPRFTVPDAMTALQSAMQSVYFETNYNPSPPTLSLAGNNVGKNASGNLSDSVQNLLPSHPIPVAAYDQFPLSVITSGTTTTFNIATIPAGFSLASATGSPVLTTAAAKAAYISSNPATPAVYLNPPVNPSPFPPGTTVASTTIPPPSYSFTLSTPLAGTLPAGTAFELLVPGPATPTATPTVWGDAEGGIATLNSAMRKAGDIAQDVGNALNTLQAAQDHASQSVNVLDAGVGNLVDANLGTVAARMTALQIKEQLATQSLGLGNQWPQLLLQLFKAPGHI
jgi:flagellin-like hook-associated protein FlgL